jgi:hypothetical protein
MRRFDISCRWCIASEEVGRRGERLEMLTAPTSASGVWFVASVDAGGDEATKAWAAVGLGEELAVKQGGFDLFLLELALRRWLCRRVSERGFALVDRRGMMSGPGGASVILDVCVPNDTTVFLMWTKIEPRWRPIAPRDLTLSCECVIGGLTARGNFWELRNAMTGRWSG